MRQALGCWISVWMAFGSVVAAPAPQWRLASDQHFEVYAQASGQTAVEILAWFEQLRAFFELEGAGDDPSARPVRVIVFASRQEYDAYRPRVTADAYYVATSSENDIVMAADPARFRLAAHEYAHLALHGSGLKLPPWLTEGLAEFFATLRIGDRGTELGGALPGRIRTLQIRTWMPLPDLLALTEDGHQRLDRNGADLFYSQSWALTEMLLLAPDYAPVFQKLVGRISSGTPGDEALTAVCGKSIERIAADLHRWVNRPVLPAIELPRIQPATLAINVSTVPAIRSRVLLAQVLLAAREYDRAEERFTGILRDAPESAEIAAALGMIALHKGDTVGARRDWKRAIDLGIGDARVCYNYALLADQAGLPPDAMRPALELAVRLQPDFDDAHYQLALLEKNSRNFDAALREFHAMRNVPESRAYAYWMALADTFNELGRRDEAQTAARHAGEHATTSAERAQAAQQIHFAQTDLGVQFSRDASGQLQMVTARVPHASPDWNPFVEPGDDMRSVQGALREIVCGSVTRIRMEQAGKLLTLAIPDLQHVDMRDAPADFVCGPQPGTPVTVDYARNPNAGASDAQGVVRRMDFRSPN
jgi:tetratricopeptide (TPR) repeat protein